MPDYIDKSIAIARITALEVTNQLATMADVKRVLADTPAADVVPVRRGTWKIGRGTDNFDIKCSECGYTDLFGVCGVGEVKIEAKLVHYCPNCGARMKVGR